MMVTSCGCRLVAPSNWLLPEEPWASRSHSNPTKVSSSYAQRRALFGSLWVRPYTTIKFVVYNHLCDMADQLNKLSITAVTVWVWTDVTYNLVNFHLCLQEACVVRRHLGLLSSTEGHWDQMRRVYIEVMQMLTDAQRGFNARVIYHYGPLVDDVLKLHPAVSLGVSPRKGEDAITNARSWYIGSNWTSH